MTVKYLDKNEFHQWDQFVDSSQQGFIFDYSWWVDILTNGDFKICALLDDDNIIVAGIILPYISRGKVSMPLLTQTMGVLFEDFSNRKNIRLQKQLTKQKEYTNMLWDYIVNSFKSFSVQFNYHYTNWLPLYWKGCKQTTKYTYVIDYSDYVPENEFKRFSKGHKWILNKVEKKSDLHVEETDNINEYLQESLKTYERQGTKRAYNDEIVKSLYESLKRRNMAKIFKCIDSKDQIHGIAIFIYNHNEVYYWLGASDAELRDSGGHTYLVWYAIQYFADKVNTFNFGGSMIEAVEKNFRNFSATPQPYYLITFEKRPILSQFKNLIKLIISKK